MQDLDWDDLRLLLVLSRAGTLARAARCLGVAETTVARRLARVEARLGQPLFERARGALRPSEAGEALLAHAGRMEREAAAAAEAAAGGAGRVAGRVRLTAVPVLANRVIAPAAAGLLARHPGLVLEIDAESGDRRLMAREADIALRLARPVAEAPVLARRIATLPLAAYRAAGMAGEGLPWIGYEAGMAALPHAAWIEAAAATPPRLRVRDAETLIGAAQGGAGLALLPRIVGDRVPGLAEHPLPEPPPPRELWLLIHPDLARLARIRAVADWLGGLFRAPNAAPPGPRP